MTEPISIIVVILTVLFILFILLATMDYEPYIDTMLYRIKSMYHNFTHYTVTTTPSTP